MNRLFSLLLSLTVSSLFSPAPSQAAEKSTLPSIPSTNAEIFTLPNGLTVIVEEDRSAPVASVQAWCATGSIHEGDWMGAGLSHILEHMLFKGTEDRPAGDIARSVQEQGGYINAYTSFDRTVYWIDVPAEGAATAVEILADAVLNSTLPEDEYVKEQEVIRREFAMGFDDPNRMSSQLMFRTVFSESPFRHPIIGYLDVYNQLTRDDVMAYFKERYVPNNMFFVVVGDVDAQAIRKQLEEAFADVPRGALKPVYVASEPEQVGRRDAHEEFPTELTRLNLAWRIPPATHPDIPAIELLGTVLGDGMSSPLNREIREKQQIAYQIGSGSYALTDGGIFLIRAVCDPDKREQVEKESLAVLDMLKTEPVSEAALDKARKNLLSGQLSALASARGKASDLGSNWHLTRNLNFSKDYLDAINRVTPADIQRVANEYFTPDKINVTSLNPPGSLTADSEQVEASKPGEVKSFELPNGLRLLVRENARLPLVSMTAIFRGGLLAEAKGNNGIGRLLASTIIKGTESRSAQELAEEIESVGGQIGGDSGNNSFSVSIEVMKPDTQLGIDLLADVLINPTFPEDEVAKERASQLAGIKAEEDQLTNVARNLLREELFGDHPYALRSVGQSEIVADLSREQLIEFHEKIVSAKNGVLAVFGDVDADAVFEMAKQAFADLPEGGDALADLPGGVKVDVNRTVTAERDKNQAILMVGFPGVDLKSEDRIAMELIDTASSDLSSRFFDRIREQLGLAYFVGTSQLVGPTPGMLVFYLGTDPEKLGKVRKEFRDEIQKLANEGLTEDELARAKKKLLGAEAIRNQSDSMMAQVIALDELFGLGAENYQARKAEVEAVTLADVKRVANKYLKESASIEAIVAPPGSVSDTPIEP